MKKLITLSILMLSSTAAFGSGQEKHPPMTYGAMLQYIDQQRLTEPGHGVVIPNAPRHMSKHITPTTAYTAPTANQQEKDIPEQERHLDKHISRTTAGYGEASKKAN